MRKAGLIFGVIFGLSLFALGLFSGSGCGSSSSDEQCQTVPISCGGKKIDACCTTSQCRYKASDGTVFNCNGTDCRAAAQQAARWCANQ